MAQVDINNALNDNNWGNWEKEISSTTITEFDSFLK
jgi:hypothetical protein